MASHHLHPLQRGRALARAEIWLGDRSRVVDTLLQRGRALARAEMPLAFGLHLAPGPASTGPRTCARGDRAIRTRHRSQDRRFNGAAHLRARRSPLRVCAVPSLPSFNGAAHLRARRSRPAIAIGAADAASTGPRTCARGDSLPSAPSASSKPLQRGRALARAEIVSSRLMGRQENLLQRGRALARAEISTWMRDCSQGSTGFNGAAHLRARRLNDPNSPTTE